jgi:hypothetical protein
VASTLVPKRTRGPNQQTPWSRNPDDGVSVLRIALDTTDPVQRRRVDAMFSAAFSIRRAVQSDARHRARAYRAAPHERHRDPAAARTRLGLSRPSLERAAYEHLDAAPHLRRFVTKALAMHVADTVWTATERHLFRDARGGRHGMPRIGTWFDFTRIPGRARSHTRDRKWETFRLHGTLAGHRAAYAKADGRFVQPRRLRGVSPDRSWWAHAGPLAVVFTGLLDGDLVLPVRLPTARSNQPILDHHLADPSRWHKIDLVRRRDPNAARGWRYEAHLMVLIAPYVGPTTSTRREVAVIETSGRSAGIDLNVSNVTVASHHGGSDLRLTRIERTPAQRSRSHRRARQERNRARHLERSRRAANRAQYQLSKRQDKRARRREAAGLPPLQVIPSGPRSSRSDGKPLQAFRNDQLSQTYRRGRAAQVASAASESQARRDHARQVAHSLVREHGFRLTVEDCNVSAWARRWGRSLSAFSPGMLLAALEREARAVAELARVPGGVLRASTRTTALSQHCLCGERVPKPLGERVHACPSCELLADRDAIAAALGAFVVFEDPADPASARVDFDAARCVLDESSTWRGLRDTLTLVNQGRQDAPSESNAHSARDGSSVTVPGRTPDPVVVARRIVGMVPRSTPDELGPRDHTTSERTRSRTNLSRRRGAKSRPLRDSS